MSKSTRQERIIHILKNNQYHSFPGETTDRKEYLNQITEGRE